MVFPANFWLVTAVAFLVSAIGFKNYIWFFSIGYGLSIAAEGVLLLALYAQTASSPASFYPVTPIFSSSLSL